MRTFFSQSNYNSTFGVCRGSGGNATASCLEGTAAATTMRGALALPTLELVTGGAGDPTSLQPQGLYLSE